MEVPFCIFVTVRPTVTSGFNDPVRAAPARRRWRCCGSSLRTGNRKIQVRCSTWLAAGYRWPRISLRFCLSWA